MRALRARVASTLAASTLVAAAAGAGTISLDARTDCGADSAAARCEVLVTNRGDEPARALRVALELDAQRQARSAGTDLAPGASWTARFEVDPATLSPGRTPVLFRIEYEDEGGYPFSALSHATLSRHGDSAPTTRLQPRLDSVLLGDEPALATLRIEGSFAPSERLAVRLLVPSELGVVGPAHRTLFATPGGPLEVTFRIENRSAFAGSSYEILALVEARSGELRDAVFAAANARVAAPPLPTQRIRPALLALLGLLGVAATLRLRRDGFRRLRAPRPTGPVLDLAILAVVLLYLVSLIPLELLFEPTTTAGGDTASHVLTAKFLAETLLPEGRLLGWMPGNLAGYPIFQLYFPLPFLAAVGLAPLFGPAVGFKLVTLLGSFLLPVCAWRAFRDLGFERPTPALAALFTLPFLLVETNSVFGGNLPSALAGEFSYSLGLSLALLFLGTSFRGLVERRNLVANAVLLALVALSHAYALLLAGALACGHLLWLPDLRRNLSYLARVFLLAFALIGFWIVPLLGYSEYTSPYRDLWNLESWREVVPPILLPLLALALLGVAATLWRRRAAGFRSLEIPARVGTLGTAVCAGVALYRLAPLLGAVDIRFLPAVQLGIALLAAPAAGALVRRVGPAPAVAWLLVGSTLLWTDSRVEFTPQWLRWNLSGFEAKPRWEEFSAVQRRLAGDLTDPRVVFEHTPAHNAAGTIRAFESLPLFSGRSTLEGLYIQSSLNSPEIFYLQSEISKVASCPLPDFHCGRLDPGRAAEHLRLFNVDRVVSRTRAVQQALTASPEYELEAEIPPYEIHRVRSGDGRYVVPLASAPVPLAGDDWRRDFFRWFKRPGSSRVTLVRVPAAGAPDLARFGPALEQLPVLVDPEPLDADGVRVEERIEPHRITVRTNRPGHPLLIKVSYHPRWRARGGEPVYLASPGFMLVVPRGREVVLEFGDPPLVRLGHFLTLCGLGVVALALGGARRRPVRIDATPAPAAAGRARIAGTLALHAALLALVWAATAGVGASYPPRLYERGLELYRQERFEAASLELERAIEAGPLSSAAVHASFYRALCAYRAGDWAEAAARFESMIERFPESPYHAEARYHVGLCRRNAGDLAAARKAFRAVTEGFASSEWGPRAVERLSEMSTQEGGAHEPT